MFFCVYWFLKFEVCWVKCFLVRKYCKIYSVMEGGKIEDSIYFIFFIYKLFIKFNVLLIVLIFGLWWIYFVVKKFLVGNVDVVYLLMLWFLERV